MWNGRHSSMGVKGRRCSTLAIGDEWSAMQKHEELCLGMVALGQETAALFVVKA